MMISPEGFVKMELQGKDRDKAIKIVKDLRKEIKQLKKEMLYLKGVMMALINQMKMINLKLIMLLSL